MDGLVHAEVFAGGKVGLVLDFGKGKGKGKGKGDGNGKGVQMAIESKEGVIKKLKLRLKVARAGIARRGGDSSYDGEGLANWWQLQA